jgi:hypothetical protein
MILKIRENQVNPGPCPLDPETGMPECPPPTEIDIIKVKKVYNECKHTQVEEIEVLFEAPTLEIITAEAEEAECVSVEVTDTNCTVLNNKNIVDVTFTVEVTTQVPLDEGGFEISSAEVTVAKKFSLSRASEKGLNVECSIFPKCLNCFISERDELGNVTQVNCCIGLLIILKLVAEVQLLIPTYGFPPQPPECEDIICPNEFKPVWPPYPS